MTAISNLESRFWSKVDKNGSIPAHRQELGNCWNWLGSTGGRGYGQAWFVGKLRPAHAVSFYLLRGLTIESGLELDHLCRNHGCVNPSHLEPVTHQENMRRGDISAMGRFKREKSHCPRGHAYSEANTYFDRHGYRKCRECHRTEAREAYRRER